MRLSIKKLFFSKQVLIFTVVFILSLMISAYYIIPLQIEKIYLALGREEPTPMLQYLKWSNFLDPQWHYFYMQDIFNRGHLIKVGITEFLSLFLGLIVLLYKRFIKKDKSLSIIEFSVFTGLLILYFTIQYSKPFYDYIKPLAQIQFPWRMLSAYMFIPGIIIPYILKDLRSKFIITLITAAFFIQYLPQLYGKNYTSYPKEHYTFTTFNLYGPEKNTVWTGRTQDYLVHKQKYSIISGKGTVKSATVKNSSRKYMLQADTDLKLVDYTFFFPGWKVYVDGKEVPIEFQDSSYRGVITYNVPSGSHVVYMKFEDTKVRMSAKIISVISIVLAFILYFFASRKKFLKS